MDVLEVGEAAVLAEFGDLDAALAHFRALDRSRPTGIRELVPAARTVLVRFDPDEIRHDRVVRWVESVVADAPGEDSAPEEIRIPVHYDGPDLHEVADLTGMTTDDVVAAHTGSLWTVAFGGFAPGFGYLTGGDPRLHVPRRSEPRTEVPTGAVGLAGEFSGIYPCSSPGGWQLIGRTEEPMWDPAREPAALLRPGLSVRFHAL